MLVVKEGVNKKDSLLTTYQIDVENMLSHKVAQLTFKNEFSNTFRTKNFIVLTTEDETLHALNPNELKQVMQWEGHVVPWGMQDDLLLNEKNQLCNLQSKQPDWQPLYAASVCKTQRARQSGMKPADHPIPFVIECGMKLSIANDDMTLWEVKSEHHLHGSVIRAFQAADNSEFVLVF